VANNKTTSRHHIRLVDLTKQFTSARGNVPAVSSVTLEIAAGSFVAFVGESGCGKTTLLKMIAGLVTPSTGTVAFVDASGTARSARDTGPLGMVFQTPALLQWRTVLQNVLLPLEVLGRRTEADVNRAKDLLRLVGLGGFEDRAPRELSGGMQQRVSIARALVSNPSILLMDEPFGALDALTRHDLRFELLRIWDETRKTIVFITHDIEEAVLLADRVIVLTPRPARIHANVEITLDRPRNEKFRLDPRFAVLVQRIQDDIEAARAASIGMVTGTSRTPRR
jgi:NitT/TauT family transport system ATP-binding protein